MGEPPILTLSGSEKRAFTLEIFAEFTALALNEPAIFLNTQIKQYKQQNNVNTTQQMNIKQNIFNALCIHFA